MKRLYGIANTSAYTIRQYVEEFILRLPEEKQSKIRPHFLGYGVPYKEDSNLIIVSGYAVFNQNLENLLESKAVVFIIESPIILAQAKIEMLDAHTKDNISWTLSTVDYNKFEQVMFEGLRTKTMVDIGALSLNIVPTLIHNARGSLTQMLLNMTATCKVPEKRRDITRTYVDWLLSKSDFGTLHQRLSQYGIDAPTLDKIGRWLNSQHGAQARKIFSAISVLLKEKKPVNYDKLCAGSTVEPFDVKYLLRHARGAEYTNVNLDSSELFKQRAARNAVPEQISEEERHIEAVYNQSYELNTSESAEELDFDSLEEVSY